MPVGSFKSLIHHGNISRPPPALRLHPTKRLSITNTHIFPLRPPSPLPPHAARNSQILPLEAASSTAFSSFTNTQSPAPEPHAPTNGTNGSSAPSDVEPNAEEEENEPEANDEIEMNDVAVWVTST